MSFEYSKWLPLVIMVSVALFFLFSRIRTQYYDSIKKFWFFEPTQVSKIRFLTYIASIILFLIALMDLRGPEERIKATIPDQKTIIIIDSSASMLAEDVRPNRFQRSLFLARHFIKRAAGHQIAVVLFSDTQKRLVPFTDDIDLLDARVAALENTDITSGNSNINQAVKESLQYFKIDNDSKEIVGNILLFTDSEEHGGVFPLDEGSDVNLAVVGVGTLAGAPLPIRSKNGVFLNYKTHKGEKVISKLNEDSIKKMGDHFKNFKYWIATSYIIPTDDILNFFKGIYKKKLGKTDIRIRPVYGHVITIVAVLIYFVSSLLSVGKTIGKPLVVLLFSLLLVQPSRSYSQQPEEKLSLDTKTRKLKAGKATSDERKLVAQELLQNGKAKEAAVLYEEIKQSAHQDINVLANLATAYAGSGKLKEAIEYYDKAASLLPEGTEREKFLSVARNNTLLAIQKKKQQSKNKKKDKEKKDKNEKDEDKKENQDKKQNKDQENDDQKKSDNKSSNQKNDEQKKQDKKDEDKEDDKKDKKDNKEKQKNDEDKKDNRKQPSNIDEKEEQIKQKRKMVKIPAMLKQIMDQDRNLQQKYYKTNNKKKRDSNERRDW